MEQNKSAILLEAGDILDQIKVLTDKLDEMVGGMMNTPGNGILASVDGYTQTVGYLTGELANDIRRKILYDRGKATIKEDTDYACNGT